MRLKAPSPLPPKAERQLDTRPPPPAVVEKTERADLEVEPGKSAPGEEGGGGDDGRGVSSEHEDSYEEDFVDNDDKGDDDALPSEPELDGSATEAKEEVRQPPPPREAVPAAADIEERGRAPPRYSTVFSEHISPSENSPSGLTASDRRESPEDTGGDILAMLRER